MKFFNKREDVIDVQLTGYGRKLLAQGRFKPTHYAFFDEGILYDAGHGGISEEPNDAQERIRNNTPYLRTQKKIHNSENAGGELPGYPQREEERLHLNLLGTMDLVSDKAPAWSVNVLKGEIDNAFSHMTGSAQALIDRGTFIKLAQVNLKQNKYETSIGFKEDATSEENCASDNVDFGLNDNEFQDGSFIKIVNNDIYLEVDELNTIFGNENFDIELFEVEEVQFSGRTQSLLRPLYFEGEDENQKVLDSTYVEYFFEVNIDDQIDEEVLKQLLAKDDARGVFSKKMLSTEEFTTELPPTTPVYEQMLEDFNIEDFEG
tara:strand:- start:944 stop:1900 length:957 start_codon:yes stop_codon:yes gene_type:complete